MINISYSKVRWFDNALQYFNDFKNDIDCIEDLQDEMLVEIKKHIDNLERKLDIYER